MYAINSVNTHETNPITPSKKRKREEVLANELGDSYFSTKQPAHWMKFKRLGTGKITAEIPETMSCFSKVIYVIENIAKQKALIGQTMDFKSRVSGYITLFNSESNYEIVADIQSNPSKFRMGLLKVCNEEDNLDDLEISFIAHKKDQYEGGLYNKNQGGGGGCARSEEVRGAYLYDITNLTPPKRYPVIKVDGLIRIQTSPGFYKRLATLEEHKLPGQSLFYSFKKIKSSESDTAKDKKVTSTEWDTDTDAETDTDIEKEAVETETEYVGGTSIDQPLRRGMQHCYASEYLDPENITKYDEKNSGTPFHKAIATHPSGTYGFNFLEVYPGEFPEDGRKHKKRRLSIQSKAGEVEKEIITVKRTLIFEGGLNAVNGGGGPISKHNRKKSV